MTSEKQLAANRRNAQKSTGPTSVAGKATSCMNAIKSGLYAKSLIIKGEKVEELQTLIDEYYAHYAPQTPDQRAFLDNFINSEWQLRRLHRAEASMWNHQMEESWTTAKYPIGKVAANNFRSHSAMQRRLDSTLRGQTRALDTLRGLPENPIPLPAPPPEAPPDLEPQPIPAPLTETAPESSPESASESPTPPVTPHAPTTSSQNGFVPSISPAPPSPAPDKPAKSPASPCEPAHIPHI